MTGWSLDNLILPWAGLGWLHEKWSLSSRHSRHRFAHLVGIVTFSWADACSREHGQPLHTYIANLTRPGRPPFREVVVGCRGSCKRRPSLAAVYTVGDPRIWRPSRYAGCLLDSFPWVVMRGWVALAATSSLYRYRIPVVDVPLACALGWAGIGTGTWYWCKSALQIASANQAAAAAH